VSSPEQGQPLILYVSATHSAVSGAEGPEKATRGEGVNGSQSKFLAGT
jgi:hypothetical protein